VYSAVRHGNIKSKCAFCKVNESVNESGEILSHPQTSNTVHPQI